MALRADDPLSAPDVPDDVPALELVRHNFDRLE
jgi:hypothetical protein